jgi:hypothetical protein
MYSTADHAKVIDHIIRIAHDKTDECAEDAERWGETEQFLRAMPDLAETARAILKRLELEYADQYQRQMRTDPVFCCAALRLDLRKNLQAAGIVD